MRAHWPGYTTYLGLNLSELLPRYLPQVLPRKSTDSFSHSETGHFERDICTPLRGVPGVFGLEGPRILKRIGFSDVRLGSFR
jgi:hypothetical protein